MAPSSASACRLSAVDALGLVRPGRREDLLLGLSDRRVEALDDGLVVVDDAVDDRVQRRPRATAQQVRALLHPCAHLVQVGLAVADCDQELVADEDEDLAEGDLVPVVVPARGLQDEEERIAVDLELRPLMRVDRVLDRQLVQLELAAHGVELLDRRLEEPDPDEGVGVAGRVVGVLESELALTAASVLVHGAVDDHPLIISSAAAVAGVRPWTRRARTCPSATRRADGRATARARSEAGADGRVGDV